MVARVVVQDQGVGVPQGQGLYQRLVEPKVIVEAVVVGVGGLLK